MRKHDRIPTRAEWWREVTNPDEIIPKGCPARTEYGENAIETLTTRGWTRATFSENARVFIDSRWTPPRPDYKVGDVIENAEDVRPLPIGSVFLDCDGEAWQVDDDDIAYGAFGGRWFMDGDFDYLPITVIYLPKVGGSDD
jgi:hypothetical protein